MVTTSELKSLLKERGWTLEWRPQAATRYASARKRINGKLVKKYLCGEHALKDMNAQDILGKLPEESNHSNEVTRGQEALVLDDLGLTIV